MTALAPERLHGLDALRGTALLLGIVLHMTMSFLPGAKYFWIVADSQPSTSLGMVFFAIHLFRMLTFFLLAGYFARLGVERLGVAAFIKDRSRRIAVPLLIGWPLSFAAIVLVVVGSAIIANGGSLPTTPSPPGPTFLPNNFPLTHLWFLWELLLMYLAALSLRAVVMRIDRGGRLGRFADRFMRLTAVPGAMVCWAAPLALALAMQPGWFAWFGIPTPDQTLYPNVPAAAGFGLAFAFGWLLQRQPALLATLRAHWPWHLLIALALVAIFLFIEGPKPTLLPMTMGAEQWLLAAPYAIAGWSATLAAIGLALRFASGYSAARRYLADASYWLYLIHLPLVMAVQVVFARVDWPWPLKFPLMLVLVLAPMLASYHACVRYTFLGDWLNGRRMPRVVTAMKTAPG